MEQSATNALGTDTRAGAGRPPSFAQERMWFLDRLAGGHSTAYVSTPMWWVRGPLDRTRFEWALARVAARHETLRSRFTDLDGVPRVLVDDHVGIPVQWREATDAAQVDREARAEADRPFDLSRGPLLRIVLWRLGDHEHVLLAAMHHIISDAWSAGLLVKELGALHDGAALPELPCTYTRFAAEQRQELEGEALHADLAFWRERLGGLPVLELPVDRARGVRPSWAGATCSFELDPELVAGLERLGREHGATLYMTLLAVFEVLIGGWCGQSDFGVGTPVAGRGRPEVEHLVGLFVNTLVVRADLSGDPAFTELLARVRDHTLDALDHQHVPYERVVRELRPGRPDTDSLIDAWFAMQNVPDTGDDTGTLHFSDFDTDRPRALFSLSLFAQPRRDGGMSMTFVYATDVFDAVSVGRLVARCRGVLAAVVASPGVRVSELGLPAGEVGVLRRWGAGEVSPGVVGDPVVLFEERVRRVPGAVAVWSGGRSVSYAELNARANRVAWWLRGRGVSAEVPVGVRVRRGVDMVAAVLGVLKAGGVYVPLDPDWPAERVAFVLGDVGASVVLEGELPDGGREDDPGVVVAAEQLAYVIFTSGSTGRPKGVGVSRGAFAVHVGRMRRRFALGAADRVLQFAALAFDASVEQIFPALSCGAALVLPGHGLIAPGTLLTELQDHRVTVMEVVPAYLSELVTELSAAGGPAEADLGPLRLLVLGGDVVRPADITWWHRRFPDTTVVNTYGPTEATVSSTVFEVPAGAGEWPGGVPLGRAVGPRSLHVLDEGLREVPAGAVGELFIGGSVLARGYVGRPGLTAQRFVPDPFGEVPGGRLYRTGDLVRWRNDGQLAFCGRADDQVKVRGFRVETGEVETRLREHPGVEDAAVVVWQDRLVAYLAGREAPAGERMRDWLGERLPAYMVPALFIAVEELPRTVGGKVDRGRLPDPDHHRPASQRTYEAPRTPAEQAVAEVWQEVLQLDEVGIHDNFFDLGGHSLLATRAVMRLRAVFGVDVGVRALFERPSVAGLADAVEEQLVREITAMSAEDVEQALRERETADVVERAPGAQDRVEKEQQA
ncbi:non-ribosomal peptide synthetase [Streptomyces sp. AHA2]|uniref:non-ribosomal peptide synthetase n=1 Tax=Streptomyces sp. AHA2 TaxID=3064526 RepID=UPI002FE2DFB0